MSFLNLVTIHQYGRYFNHIPIYAIPGRSPFIQLGGKQA